MDQERTLSDSLVNSLNNVDVSSEDIMKEFIKLYQKTDNMKFWHRLFVCHATACNRNDVIKQCAPFFVSKDLNPLTVAVKTQNLELIELFLKAGYRADGIEYDGFVRDFLNGELFSALCITLIQDDVKVMMMLRKVHKEEWILYVSISRHAIKCFRELFQEVDIQNKTMMEKILSLALMYDLDILKELVGLGHFDVNHQWVAGNGTPLHHTVSNLGHRGGDYTCYLTLTKYLLSAGAKAFVYDQIFAVRWSKGICL